MQSTADKMINALDAFNAGPEDDRAALDLYNITDGFETLPDKTRARTPLPRGQKSNRPRVFSHITRSAG